MAACKLDRLSKSMSLVHDVSLMSTSLAVYLTSSACQNRLTRPARVDRGWGGDVPLVGQVDTQIFVETETVGSQ